MCVLFPFLCPQSWGVAHPCCQVYFALSLLGLVVLSLTKIRPTQMMCIMEARHFFNMVMHRLCISAANVIGKHKPQSHLFSSLHLWKVENKSCIVQVHAAHAIAHSVDSSVKCPYKKSVTTVW